MNNVIKFDNQAWLNRRKYIGFYPKEKRISVKMPKGWAFRPADHMQVHIDYWEPKGMRMHERNQIIDFYHQFLKWQVDIIEYKLGEL